MEHQYPAGWYQHPDGDTRWWDGAEWHKPPPLGPATPLSAPSGNNATVFLIVGAIIAVTLLLVCCGGGAILMRDSSTGDSTTSYEYNHGYSFGEALEDSAPAEESSQRALCETGAGLGDTGDDGYVEGTDEFDNFVQGCLDAIAD